MIMSHEDILSEVGAGSRGRVAAILGHPSHPRVVPITIGMYVSATCADVALVRIGDTFWTQGTS